MNAPSSVYRDRVLGFEKQLPVHQTAVRNLGEDGKTHKREYGNKTDNGSMRKHRMGA
jgi:hypothetical protein